MAVYDTAGSQGVHIDKVLTGISVGYPNKEFVGNQFFTEIRVTKQSDLYNVFGREQWVLEPGQTYRAPGSESYEIPGLDVSQTPYFAREHSLQIGVTDEERENADTPLSPDRDGTELVTAKVLLGRELDIRALMHATANYATNHTATLVGTQQWNDYTNSTPIVNIKDARRQVHGTLFMEMNKWLFPWQVMSYLEDHPDFIERIKYSQAGVITADIIARVLGISNIVVPEVGYNSGVMGGTETLAYIWGKNVIGAIVPARASQKQVAFGWEFVWRYPGGQTQVAERWRENNRKRDVIRVSRRYDLIQPVVGAGGGTPAGYLIEDAIA